MALFKIFRGDSSQLPAEKKDGYAYFLVDTQQLLIDYGNQRLEVKASGSGTAEVAKYLVALDDEGNIIQPEDKFSVSDFLLADPDGLAVKAGGTGRNTLTANAVLIGNGTESIKQITLIPKGLAVGDGSDGIKGVAAIGSGSLVVGDDTNGVKGLTIDANKVMLGDATNGAKGVAITDKALVMGDTTNGIKSFVPVAGQLLIGDADDGVKGLHGTGVLFAETDNEPQFDTAPVKVGGTGKTSVTEKALVIGNGESALGEIANAKGVLKSDGTNAPTYGTADVELGGTGKDTLTKDALIIGNGTDAVGEIANAAGVLVSNGTDTPEYVDKLAIENGGTGADNAEDARDNLGVYSKDEIDSMFTDNSSSSAPTELGGNDGDWTYKDGKWTQTITVDGLKANVPPIIMNTSNPAGYALIESAVADGDAGTITFTASEKPTGPIGLTVVDI